MPRLTPLLAALILGLGSHAANAAPGASLAGWAALPAATFSPGPVSGQFIGSGPFNGGHLPPYAGQPVQGFSAVLDGPAAGTYYVMADNGFGSKANSPDALLRMYAVRPDWAGKTVRPVDFHTGAALPAFTPASYLTLHDPDGKLGFKITAEFTQYPGSATLPVDPAIRTRRLLTGWDLDLESVRKDKHGNFWFSDEFGPFLIKTDAQGKVLRSEIPLPGVKAPQNPYLGGDTPNLGTSRGFEGLALNPAGDTLYTLLEGTVTGDPPKSLRINAFDLASESYTGFQAFYKLEPQGAAIGDMTAVDARRFLVIERDNGQGASAAFKKVFLVDLEDRDADGFVKKTELADLMNLADPDDLNGDGLTRFSFPFVTIESVLLVDAQTLLVINDNNYPFSNGRMAGVADDNEFILVRLAQPVPEPETWAMLAAGLGLVGFAVARRKPAQ